MSKRYSFVACCLIVFVFLTCRVYYSEWGRWPPLKVTTWDALGYYMYLPAIFIYNDTRELNWFPSVDEEYAVSGGVFYQAGRQENGSYVFKYLGGVAILQMPFFFAGHLAAGYLGYKTDGFSSPYQWAVAIGALFYFAVMLFVLRKVLLRFFSDTVVAITLVLLCLATNMIQYVAADSAQSHSFLLPLYALLLYTSVRWHEKPALIHAVLTGYIIGLATICRPTEAVMLFIPLLWNLHSKEKAKEKWSLVKRHKSHLVAAVIAGFAAILPQLVYWQYSTGSFIYNVGSKWDFLTPHLRVLTGWEKGWIIYTPVTLFFLVGLFFVNRFPFKKAVVVFCLLNLYIIISWHDWRYGGSYSARALVQSYPVFALPFAAFISKIILTRWRFGFFAMGLFLVYLNLFQIW
ncbi:MAG: glycosyltransferase family 39 protein, partial [Bacteroidales bacterium]|nr:glycosyltransferase family 39 protein [Bacteroidales bacterium]